MKKKYLVAVQLGLGDVKGYVVEIANDYVPWKDDMAKLKRELVRRYRPCYSHLVISSSVGSTSVWIEETNKEIPAEYLNVISASLLDL